MAGQGRKGSLENKSKVRKFLVMGLRVMEREDTFSGLSPQVKDNI